MTWYAARGPACGHLVGQMRRLRALSAEVGGGRVLSQILTNRAPITTALAADLNERGARSMHGAETMNVHPGANPVPALCRCAQPVPQAERPTDTLGPSCDRPSRLSGGSRQTIYSVPRSSSRMITRSGLGRSTQLKPSEARFGEAGILSQVFVRRGGEFALIGEAVDLLLVGEKCPPQRSGSVGFGEVA